MLAGEHTSALDPTLELVIQRTHVGEVAHGAHGYCAWCFDLLLVGGKDVRSEPLEERRARLEALLAGADADLLRFSEAFDDAEKLLLAALELGLEGIVSKKRDQPYRSGKNLGWVKVKTAACGARRTATAGRCFSAVHKTDVTAG